MLRPASPGRRRRGWSRVGSLRQQPALAGECTLSINLDKGLFSMNSDFVFQAAHEKHLDQIFSIF